MGVEGAGPGAVAVAQASELAQPVAAVEALDGLAALDALELVLFPFLAKIDQEKCVGCQICVKECPVGVIHVPSAE